MYLLVTICLLGFSSAQKVTELTSCLTKDNSLQMDCKYESATASTAKPLSCKYTVDGKVVGSTDSAVSQDSTFKNRTSISIEGTTCRLSLNLTGIVDSNSKATQNYTCIIKQQAEVMKATSVDKNLLPKCSTSLAVQGQSYSALLLAMMTLPLLLEVHWP